MNWWRYYKQINGLIFFLLSSHLQKRQNNMNKSLFMFPRIINRAFKFKLRILASKWNLCETLLSILITHSSQLFNSVTQKNILWRLFLLCSILIFDSFFIHFHMTFLVFITAAPEHLDKSIMSLWLVWWNT